MSKNIITLWNNWFAGDQTFPTPYCCWTSNIPAWSYTGTTQTKLNTSVINGNTTRITCKVAWTGSYISPFLGILNASTTSTSPFTIKAEKFRLSFDSVSCFVNNTLYDNGVGIIFAISYMKTDNTAANHGITLTSPGVAEIDTSTLDGYGYTTGIRYMLDVYSMGKNGNKNFIPGDYFDIENLTIEALNGEVISNEFAPNYFRPIITLLNKNIPIGYSNTDINGSELIASTPVNFPAIIEGNSCGNFNGNSDYISLGDMINFESVSKLSIRFILTETNDTDMKCLCNGLIGMSSNNSIWIDSDKNIIFHGSVFNTGLQYNTNYLLEVDITNSDTIKLNGDIITKSSVSSLDTSSSNVTIGKYSDDETSYFNGCIFDVKCLYGDNIIHWYPLAEGDGLEIYDAVSGINGNLTTTSVSTFWSKKQNVFAYNALNGYGKIANSDAKIPLGIVGITYIEQHNKLDNGVVDLDCELGFSQGVSKVPELTKYENIANKKLSTITAYNTLAPLYVNIKDNGLSNFMLYSMNQNGMDITRMQNHLKHG